MKIVGIIAEYNPFHNGHQYHIDQALQKTGADAAIVLMSGDFVQRGAPAIAPKHLRAKAALLGGASLILELPVLFSCGSAELFARGAVSIFNSLGCISYLCFGSECGDIKKLNRLARILSEEPEVYRQLLQDELRKGRPFPQARQTALSAYTKDPSLAEILSSPNNTLGIEYLKALRYFKSPIQPFAIPREGSGYHDTALLRNLQFRNCDPQPNSESIFTRRCFFIRCRTTSARFFRSAAKELPVLASGYPG